MESHGSGFAESLFNVGTEGAAQARPGLQAAGAGRAHYRARAGGVRYQR